MLKYFHGITTLAQAKERYLQLCKKFHPDVTYNSTATFQEMKSEFERVCTYFELQEHLHPQPTPPPLPEPIAPNQYHYYNYQEPQLHTPTSSEKISEFLNIGLEVAQKFTAIKKEFDKL